MPLRLGSAQASFDAGLAALPALRPEREVDIAPRAAPTLEIWLLNNMPDAALQATERQFIRLLNNAARQRLVRLHFFSLPSVPRSAEAKERIAGGYSDFADLRRSGLDGLI